MPNQDQKDRRPKSLLEAFLLGYVWYRKDYGQQQRIKDQPVTDCILDCAGGGSRTRSSSTDRDCSNCRMM
jgi:hypothetical protein